MTFFALGIVAVVAKWWGVVLGVLILAWAIGGALGKCRGPMTLIFGEHSRRIGATALSIFLGGYVTMCGVASAKGEEEQEEKKARKAEEEAAQKAFEKAELEKREAEAAVARSAHEAKLKADVERATSEFRAGLQSVQDLFTKGKVREADEELKRVASAVADYRKIEPIPPQIAAVFVLQDRLSKEIAPAAEVVSAVDRLNTAMTTARDRVKGSKDLEDWKVAQSLWKDALSIISSLESQNDDQKALIPKDLAKKRKSVEDSLSKADKIVEKHELEVAKEQVYLALCGDEPVGCGGGWDGECIGTEYAFKQVANDPSDVEVEGCSPAVLTDEDCWHSTCTVFARNAFGGRVRQRFLFRFSKLGVEVVRQVR